MKEQKQHVADFMNRLYDRGLTTASGGNVSVRMPGVGMLITASATDKGRMTADGVVAIGFDGTVQPAGLQPSIEAAMHLEIYRRCAPVQAIVHAHPSNTCAFTASRRRIDTRLTAEAYALLGEPHVVPYARMGSAALASAVASVFADGGGCSLLENHGVVCVGATLLQAFNRLEVLEQAARITRYAEALGNVRRLTDAQCREIDEMGLHG